MTGPRRLPASPAARALVLTLSAAAQTEQRSEDSESVSPRRRENYTQDCQGNARQGSFEVSQKRVSHRSHSSHD